MAVDISIATSAAEREAVYRFRYDIYVREMGRKEPEADHARGRLTDAADSTAVIFAGAERSSGRIVGTLRTNFLAAGRLPKHEDLYGLTGLSEERRAVTSITTRLMVAPQRRRTRLAIELARAAYGHAVPAGIEVDYIDCNFHLLEFFTGLGYRWIQPIVHPDYGQVHLMRMVTGDVGHLRGVRSPLLGVPRESAEPSERSMLPCPR